MCLNPFIKVNDKAFSLVDSAETIVLDGVRFRGVPSHQQIMRLSGYDKLNIVDNYCQDSPELVDTFKDNNYIYFHGHKLSLFSVCPCGKCTECHYCKVTEFESRILMEAAAFPEMYFFTLTYDDKHLPSEGLRKSDMVLFNKRLRFRIFKQFGARVRLVYCGEYGKTTHRPHYHGLIFFDRLLSMSERYQFFALFNHTKQYRSEHPDTDNIWPLGFRRDIQFCKNPGASARYLSKYVTKQQLAKPDLSYHYTPEFIQTPRGCALGCTELHKYDDFMAKTNTGSLRLRVCGQISTTKVNRKMVDKYYPNLSTFVPGYRHILSEFNLLLREIDARELGWLPDDIVNDAYFHVKYLNNLVLSTRQRNRNLCMEQFISHMTDTELCDNLFYLSNQIIHQFPTESEYHSLVLKKQNFFDRICNTDLDRLNLRSEQRNRYQSRIDYVQRRMIYAPTLE